MIDPFPGLVGFAIFYSPISEPPYPPDCQALTARCRGWFGGSDAVYLRATAGNVFNHLSRLGEPSSDLRRTERHTPAHGNQPPPTLSLRRILSICDSTSGDADGVSPAPSLA
jgi:hypothetical protein